MTTYLERMALDPALRAFVDAQAGQIAVELQALRVEHAHALQVIESQKTNYRGVRASNKTSERDAMTETAAASNWTRKMPIRVCLGVQAQRVTGAPPSTPRGQ